MSRVLQSAEPGRWKEHRFGLSDRSWCNLEGRSFWVTGAGTGFGQAIAVALAAAGASVFLTGRRAEKLQGTLEIARSLGVSTDRCICVPADIRDESALVCAVSVIREWTSSLYGLVSCAALPEPGAIRSPLSDLPESDWSRMFDTNVKAQWLVARAAAALLAAQDGCRVLFLSSEAGWAATPGFGPYNACKAALNSLSASLAAEWARDRPGHDVQVNVLVPGEARTEMNQGSADSPFSAASMTLILLSQNRGGPNGCFFHRDGRHLGFAYSKPYDGDLLSG